MKKIIVCLWLFCAGCLLAQAQSKASADSAYAQERYDEAIRLYTALLKSGESADIYYNIGNCYYKKDDMARAVLHYERAALLNPGDADIRFNLELARSKTIDKITPEHEMFFITWFRAGVDCAGADQWARLALCAFVLMLLSFALFLFASKVSWKKVGFFVALLLFLVVVASNVFAYMQKQQLTHRTGAVVMASSVVVKSTPNASGTDLFVLHEGTRVEVVDATMRDWAEIRLADGKIGWMPKAQMEII